MDEYNPGFLAEMARELESSMRKLEGREIDLIAELGGERVAELRALWARTLPPDDEEELKRNMDWSDRELIWVWSRLERVREKRVLVGRRSMRLQSVGRGAGDGEPQADPGGKDRND